MTRGSALVTICAGGAIALCVTVAAAAQQVATQPEKARSATVRLQMLKTERTGPVSEGSSGGVTDLAPGKTATLWGWLSERPNVPNGRRCTTGSGAADPGVDFTEPWKRFGGNDAPLQAWMVQVQLIEARVDSVTLGLALGHMVRGDGPGWQVQGRGEKRTLTLAAQQPYVLGYVDGDSANCDWANVMVRLSAEPNPVPNASAALGYEVWLVHDDNRGNRTTDSQQGFVAQGDLAHVSFRPHLWPLSGVYGGRIPGTSCDVQIEMSLDFRGRIREDGLIDLSVEPQRTFKLILPDRVATPSMLGSPGAGRKMLTVKADEPVEFVLPEPVERFQNTRCRATEKTIDVRTLFPGQKTSLILKIRKEP